MAISLSTRSLPGSILLLLAMLLTGSVAGRDVPAATGTGEVGLPYGPGSSWVVGHELFAAGDIEEALPLLHLAYRSAPGVPMVALEFQEALQARGYLDDAMGVLDSLVSDFPDSLSFRFLRARLAIRLGHKKDAKAELAYLRRQKGVTPDMVSLEASLLSALGDVSGAMSVLREGLDLFPHRGAAIYRGMITVLQQNDRPQDILPVVQEAVAKFPDDPGLRLSLIATLAESGGKKEALQAAAEADDRFHLPAFLFPDSLRTEDQTVAMPADAPPLPASFRVELADVYAQNGDLESAMGLLAEMEAKGELDLGPSLWLARIYLGNGRFTAGKDLVDRILERWPQAARGWFLRGKILERIPDWEETIAAYRRAVEYDARDPEIRLALVRSMMLADEDKLAAGDADSAGQAYRADFVRQTRAASTLVPRTDHDGQMVLGYAMRLIGDLDRAAWHFQLAAEKPELRLNALIQASMCYDQDHKTDRARALLETLRQENPHNPEIANSLGYFLAEKNMELEEAERLVKEALDADPSNGAYLDSMGWIRYRQGRPEKALDYLIRAVNVLPDDPVILEHIGIVLRDQGRQEEARDMFRRALGLGGDAIRLRGLLDALGTDSGD